MPKPNHSGRARPFDQLRLFVPPGDAQTWQSLAAQTSAEIVELLASLLLQMRQMRSGTGRERGDE